MQSSSAPAFEDFEDITGPKDRYSLSQNLLGLGEDFKKFVAVMTAIVKANVPEEEPAVLGNPQFARVDLSRISKICNAFVFASNAALFKDALRAMENGRLDDVLSDPKMVPFLGRNWRMLESCSSIYSERGGCGLLSRALRMNRKCISWLRKSLPVAVSAAVHFDEADLFGLEKKWAGSGLARTVSLRQISRQISSISTADRTLAEDPDAPSKPTATGSDNQVAKLSQRAAADLMPSRFTEFAMEDLAERPFTALLGAMSQWLNALSVDRVTATASGEDMPKRRRTDDTSATSHPTVSQVARAFCTGTLLEPSKRARQHILDTFDIREFTSWSLAAWQLAASRLLLISGTVSHRFCLISEPSRENSNWPPKAPFLAK